MRAEKMVERVWPGRDAQIEVLGGGITNCNFKVVLDDGAYMLPDRRQGHGAAGIDRRVEHEASLVAAAVGVGPEVVAFIEPGAISSRVSSKVTSSRPRRSGSRRRFAGSPSRCEPCTPARRSRRPFDPFRVVEAYAATAALHGITVPDASRLRAETANRIERARGPAPERPCHNDLLTANFIDDGSRIRIVDWEYAGMGDVFFDLANFVVDNADLIGGKPGLPPRVPRRSATRGRAQADADAVSMSDFREAMWGVVQQAVSDLDFDFRACGEHFERMRRTASERAFRRALGWASAREAAPHLACVRVADERVLAALKLDFEASPRLPLPRRSRRRLAAGPGQVEVVRRRLVVHHDRVAAGGEAVGPVEADVEAGPHAALQRRTAADGLGGLSSAVSVVSVPAVSVASAVIVSVAAGVAVSSSSPQAATPSPRDTHRVNRAIRQRFTALLSFAVLQALRPAAEERFSVGG